jgi:hypothetical protein
VTGEPSPGWALTVNAGPVDGVTAEVAAYIEGQIAQVHGEIDRVERAIQALAGGETDPRVIDEILIGDR